MKQKRQISPMERATTFGDVSYVVLTTAVLIFALLAMLIPIVHIIASSFSSAEAVSLGKVAFWPVEATFDGYREVFNTSSVIWGFKNSIVYTIFGTCINLVITMLAAYPLSRKDLRCRNFVMVLFSFTMLFSGGMIPSYLLVSNLGLLDTIWAMVIPGAMSVYNVIVLRTYISSSIPYELYESATLEGCSDFRYLVQIVVPLSEPILAVLVLWYAVGHWNSYFNAMIYLRTYTKNPLQIILRNMLILDEFTKGDFSSNVIAFEKAKRMRDLYKYSLIVVSTVPVMMLYPVIQKHFVKGVMLGSIKG